ncbi:MAG: trypsin-like serine protease [Nannocystis sp.]|nr:trypsin-like serine protease [Nannocystis sp.]
MKRTPNNITRDHRATTSPAKTTRVAEAALLLLCGGGLIAGCYEGFDGQELAEDEDEDAVEAADGEGLADARAPLEISHAELFDGEIPPPPLDDGENWDFSDATQDPSAIYGGTTVPVCGWPAAVELGGSCTGSLVHPQVVIYAAHCGQSYSKIYFGEDYTKAAFSVTPSSCQIYPGGGPGKGNDFAVCKLSQPVTNVPITPILMGCETQILKQGQAVTLVGFGNANNGPYGIKRHVTTTINQISNANEIHIGGNGKDTCQGDSGGPAYVQLADGTWRVFGITSYGGACGGGGWYSMMHVGMSWFESVTGVDLTPCHTANGTWSPTASCGGFAYNPANAGGTWGGGCNTGSVGGFSATCGAAYSQQQQPPPPPPPQQQAPCVGCTLYSGSLSGPGAQQQQPSGTYYQSVSYGAHEGYLQGPAGSDFDLYLYRWQNNTWALVAKAETNSTNETIKFNGSAGYYTWVIRSYSGAGSYSFYLKRP